MIVRMVVGLVLTVAAFGLFGRRLWYLKRLAFSGQPAPERLEYAKANVGTEVKTQFAAACSSGSSDRSAVERIQNDGGAPVAGSTGPDADTVASWASCCSVAINLSFRAWIPSPCRTIIKYTYL
jgi:hypothetical protein